MQIEPGGLVVVKGTTGSIEGRLNQREDLNRNN